MHYHHSAHIHYTAISSHETFDCDLPQTLTKHLGLADLIV